MASDVARERQPPEGEPTRVSGRAASRGRQPSDDLAAPGFRWQALFRRTSDALFLLNHQRRFLFVNPAWEGLTGLTASVMRGLACIRRLPTAGDSWDIVVRSLCCPPPEVLGGKAIRVRRPVPGSEAARRRWDIEFLPFFREPEASGDADGSSKTSTKTSTVSAAVSDYAERGPRLLGILGKITPVLLEPAVGSLPLPAALIDLRERQVQWHDPERLPTEQPATRQLVEQIRLASRVRVPVHILGEAGAGKEWTARAIHYTGADQERAFMSLNCQGLPPRTLAALLFSDDGPFGLADMLPENQGRTTRTSIGTVYLRELVALPLDLQARLVQLLVQSDYIGPRIMAGSSISPVEAVRQGRLLDELRCALGIVVIEVPPLRNRLDDLPWLVERFLERAGAAHATLAPEVWSVLRSHSWPGNLRELSAVLTSALAHAAGKPVRGSDLPAYLTIGPARPAGPDRVVILDQVLESVERRLILLALRKAKGNKSRAAELLSIWRPRLLRRMEALGIGESEHKENGEQGASAP